MDVIQAITYKRAVRQFQERQIPDDILKKILYAGRRSQSSKNTQPWDFVVIKNRERLRALSKLGNYADHIAGAAVGLAIITPHPETKMTILFDAGQAAAYMQLAAWELGVGSCLATIYETDAACRLLKIPEDRFIHIAISFGYPSDENVFTSNLEKGGRKSLSEVVHWEEW